MKIIDREFQYLMQKHQKLDSHWFYNYTISVKSVLKMNIVLYNVVGGTVLSQFNIKCRQKFYTMEGEGIAPSQLVSLRSKLIKFKAFLFSPATTSTTCIIVFTRWWFSPRPSSRSGSSSTTTSGSCTTAFAR